MSKKFAKILSDALDTFFGKEDNFDVSKEEVDRFHEFMRQAFIAEGKPVPKEFLKVYEGNTLH